MLARRDVGWQGAELTESGLAPVIKTDAESVLEPCHTCGICTATDRDARRATLRQTVACPVDNSSVADDWRKTADKAADLVGNR